MVFSQKSSLATVVMVVAGIACRDATSPQPNVEHFSFSAAEVASDPGTGVMTVRTTTTGNASEVDPDGYAVVLAGSAGQPIGGNGALSFTNLPPGNQAVQVTGLAENCAVVSNPRTVRVLADGSTTTTFDVYCGVQAPTRMVGAGQLGDAAVVPGNDAQSFDYDIRSDLTGRFRFTECAIVEPDGNCATVIVDGDPRTRITAFVAMSNVCPDPSRGVEISGLGRLPGLDIAPFTLVMCDSDVAPGFTDCFTLDIPEPGPGQPRYAISRYVTSGGHSKLSL